MPMACRTLKPPKVMSEMPSSVFLRHTAMTWGTKSNALQMQAQSEDHGNNLLHRFSHSAPEIVQRAAGLCLGCFFFAVPRRRVGFKRGRRRDETAVTSSTAARNAASLAFEGLVKPLILRTNCKRGRANLLVGDGGIEVEKHFDIPAHFDRNLRPSSRIAVARRLRLILYCGWSAQVSAA